VSGDAQPLLNSGTFALLAPSIANLALQQERQQVALLVRPGAPPEVAFGNGTDPKTDPLLRVTIKQLSIDFYIWSLDRFIRAMTLTINVDLPMNLTVTPDGLTPELAGDAITAANATITNSQLLSEEPKQIASKLQGLIKTAVGQLGGVIPPVKLSNAL